jgi:hypothetical protein
MTDEESRNGKSQQSGSARKEKMANRALLAAVSILSASLGVTAAQSAVEVTAAKGSSTRDFNTKLAAIDAYKPKLQSNQIKGGTPPLGQKPVSKGTKIEMKRPIEYSTPSPSGPQVKPKR